MMADGARQLQAHVCQGHAFTQRSSYCLVHSRCICCLLNGIHVVRRGPRREREYALHISQILLQSLEIDRDRERTCSGSFCSNWISLAKSTRSQKLITAPARTEERQENSQPQVSSHSKDVKVCRLFGLA